MLPYQCFLTHGMRNLGHQMGFTVSSNPASGLTTCAVGEMDDKWLALVMVKAHVILNVE